MNLKQITRQKMRSRLKLLSPAVLASASDAICHHFCSHPQSKVFSPTIAVFSAHGPEIQLMMLHHDLPEAQLVYPLCHAGGILTFHHVTNHSELRPGILDILEPNPSIHPEINIREIDIFLCPGIAFTQNGSRLGQGGGFYDRALVQRNQKSVTIGVGLQLQILNTIPCDPHDIPLDFILTENGYLG